MLSQKDSNEIPKQVFQWKKVIILLLEKIFFSNQKVLLFFLFLHENVKLIMYTSVRWINEYRQHVFVEKHTKKIFFWIPLLSSAMSKNSIEYTRDVRNELLIVL